MDLAHPNLLSTQAIIDILIEVSYNLRVLQYFRHKSAQDTHNFNFQFQFGFQRRLDPAALTGKCRQELVDIYNRFVLPLPQRSTSNRGHRAVPDARVSLVGGSSPPKSIRLKRKLDIDSSDLGSCTGLKVVRHGISEMKLEQLKRPAANEEIMDCEDGDDAMIGHGTGDGQRVKRKPITWP